MLFSVVCTLIDKFIHIITVVGVLLLASPQQILTTVMTRTIVDKSIDHAKSHLICFLPQYQG